MVYRNGDIMKNWQYFDNITKKWYDESPCVISRYNTFSDYNEAGIRAGIKSRIIKNNMKIESLSTPVAFLNGTIGLCGPEEELFDMFKSIGINPILVEDLYKHPQNLLDLKKHSIKTLCIQTTGNNFEDVNKAIAFFETMNFVPENIVLIFTEPLWCIAKDFKQEHPETMIYEYRSFRFGSDDLLEEFTFGS